MVPILPEIGVPKAFRSSQRGREGSDSEPLFGASEKSCSCQRLHSLEAGFPPVPVNAAMGSRKRARGAGGAGVRARP